MKAILVVEMPNNCEECPCCYGFICSPLAREMGIWGIHNGKPTDCPLKPMPRKREPKEEWLNEYHRDEFADGWNACLEKITGETE